MYLWHIESCSRHNLIGNITIRGVPGNQIINIKIFKFWSRVCDCSTFNRAAYTQRNSPKLIHEGILDTAITDMLLIL